MMTSNCNQEDAYVFRENYGNARWGLGAETMWRPPTDVYETDSTVVVVIEIAGLGPNDYEIMLQGRSLIFCGKRPETTEKLAYQQMEIRHGPFRTQVHLPWALESTGQQAIYENGFLKITLPKALVRRVPVRTSAESAGEANEGETE